ncbi:hypothetical protein ACQRBF_07940 [Peptoniphilaceae bacterium SGI.131]
MRFPIFRFIKEEKGSGQFLEASMILPLIMVFIFLLINISFSTINRVRISESASYIAMEDLEDKSDKFAALSKDKFEIRDFSNIFFRTVVLYRNGRLVNKQANYKESQIIRKIKFASELLNQAKSLEISGISLEKILNGGIEMKNKIREILK